MALLEKLPGASSWVVHTIVDDNNLALFTPWKIARQVNPMGAKSSNQAKFYYTHLSSNDHDCQSDFLCRSRHHVCYYCTNGWVKTTADAIIIHHTPRADDYTCPPTWMRQCYSKKKIWATKPRKSSVLLYHVVVSWSPSKIIAFPTPTTTSQKSGWYCHFRRGCWMWWFVRDMLAWVLWEDAPAQTSHCLSSLLVVLLMLLRSFGGIQRYEPCCYRCPVHTGHQELLLLTETPNMCRR
jgi:hypothetical protein